MSISETRNVNKWLMINEIINYMNKYREKLETIKTSGSEWNLENGRQNGNSILRVTRKKNNSSPIAGACSPWWLLRILPAKGVQDIGNAWRGMCTVSSQSLEKNMKVLNFVWKSSKNVHKCTPSSHQQNVHKLHPKGVLSNNLSC